MLKDIIHKHKLLFKVGIIIYSSTIYTLANSSQFALCSGRAMPTQNVNVCYMTSAIYFLFFGFYAIAMARVVYNNNENRTSGPPLHCEPTTNYFSDNLKFKKKNTRYRNMNIVKLAGKCMAFRACILLLVRGKFWR